MHFARSASGPGDSAAGVTIYENNPKKLPHLSPKQGCSWSIAVTQLRSVLRVHANTSIPDVY